MDHVHVKLNRLLYTGIGHKPFPVGAELHLPQALAEELVGLGHAEKTEPPLTTES